MPRSRYTRCLYRVCPINRLQAARTSLQLIDGGGAWWAIYCSWAEPWQIFYRTSNFRLSWQAINKQASKQTWFWGQQAKQASKQAKGCFACLLAYQQVCLTHICKPCLLSTNHIKTTVGKLWTTNSKQKPTNQQNHAQLAIMCHSKPSMRIRIILPELDTPSVWLRRDRNPIRHCWLASRRIDHNLLIFVKKLVRLKRRRIAD